METLPAAVEDDSSGANPRSIKSEDSSPQHDTGRGSPPPNCAICLGTCRNKSFTDSCFHQFCFKCLLTWSKVKAECPLCKQNFRSIIHNVRSNHQYEQYVIEQRQQAEEPVARHTVDIDNLTTTRRFRYRTTLTLPRRESVAIQQLLLHYPMVADVIPSPRHPPRRRSPTSFRRTVYRHNLWARPLPDFTGRYRMCTPMFFRYNDSQMHRLVPWLNRELHHLLNENPGHVSYVIARILELLTQHHINSNEFKEAMQRYFGYRTEHFLHELYCFASTPYDLTGYDRNVQYTTDARISTMINEVISSSESEASVDSDIVMVSSSEAAEPPPGPSRVPAPVYPQGHIAEPPADNVIPIESLSQSDTDDDSSEVMVVGYIKPPQDRTPEVVDLLGSDSDVIVQEGAPEPAAAAPPEGASLVKLSLKRHRARDATDSEDSAYTPPPPARAPHPRRRSDETATTSDTCRTTPSPAPLLASAPTWDTDSASCDSDSPLADRAALPLSAPPLPPPCSTSSHSSSDVSSASLSSGRRKRLHKRRPRRKPKEPEPPPKPKPRRPAKRARKERKPAAPAPSDNEKSRKRKSDTGKGVKSSKKAVASVAVTTAEAAVQAALPGLDQPSTSGAQADRKAEPDGAKDRKPDLRSAKETRRLRSVVSVINGCKNSSEPTDAGNAHTANDVCEARGRRTVITSLKKVGNTTKYQISVIKKDETESDSSDDLPLNLSVRKNYSNSLTSNSGNV